MLFDSARSGYKHRASYAKKTWRLNTIARLLSEKSLTRHSFHVMESKVSRNCTGNIHRPSTPEKEVNRKKNTVGKIAKRGSYLVEGTVASRHCFHCFLISGCDAILF